METREELNKRLEHEAVALGSKWARAKAWTPELERVCAIDPEGMKGGGSQYIFDLAEAMAGTALTYDKSCEVVVPLWDPEDQGENYPELEHAQAFVRGASMAAVQALDGRDLAKLMARSFVSLEKMVPKDETPRGAALMAGAIALGHLKLQANKQAEEVDRLREVVYKIVGVLSVIVGESEQEKQR